MSVGRSGEKRQTYCHRSGDGAYFMSDCHRLASFGFPGLTECIGFLRPMPAGPSWSRQPPRLARVTQGERLFTL